MGRLTGCHFCKLKAQSTHVIPPKAAYLLGTHIYLRACIANIRGGAFGGREGVGLGMSVCVCVFKYTHVYSLYKISEGLAWAVKVH